MSRETRDFLVFSSNGLFMPLAANRLYIFSFSCEILCVILEIVCLYDSQPKQLCLVFTIVDENKVKTNKTCF